MTTLFLFITCVGTFLMFLARQVAQSSDFVGGYERLTITAPYGFRVVTISGDYSLILPPRRSSIDADAIARQILPDYTLFNDYSEKLGEQEVLASEMLYDRYDVLRRAIMVRIKGVLDSHGLNMYERREVWRAVWRIGSEALLREVASAA